MHMVSTVYIESKEDLIYRTATNLLREYPRDVNFCYAVCFPILGSEYFAPPHVDACATCRH